MRFGCACVKSRLTSLAIKTNKTNENSIDDGRVFSTSELSWANMVQEEKTNHYSQRFSSKSTEELRTITQNHDYSDDAQLAAVWELERRGESSEMESAMAEKITDKRLYQEEVLRKERKYSTFWPRLLAAIIDSVLLALVFSVPEIVDIFGAPQNLSTSWWFEVISGYSGYIYYIVMHGKYGQTIGKMVVGVKVVDHFTENSISYRQALLRDVVPLLFITWSVALNLLANMSVLDLSRMTTTMIIIGGISSFWVWLEILTMLTNSKSRALHDFIAKTVVIRMS